MDLSPFLTCPRCAGSGRVAVQPGLEATCGRCAGEGQVARSNLRFKLDDEVKLTEAALRKYGYGPSQGQGGTGVVVLIRGEESPDLTRPYMVKWATHPSPNSYRDEDLAPAAPAFRFRIVGPEDGED